MKDEDGEDEDEEIDKELTEEEKKDCNKLIHKLLQYLLIFRRNTLNLQIWKLLIQRIFLKNGLWILVNHKIMNLMKWMKEFSRLLKKNLNKLRIKSLRKEKEEVVKEIFLMQQSEFYHVK